MMYKDKNLTFDNDRIYYNDSDFGGEVQVMMDWEDPLMSASAAYICSDNADILEIGFGMGISAGYIQSHSIASHTIIENHPQIITKAQEWAQGKSNVTIVTGSWYDVRSELSTYDGIFYDTFGDNNWQQFSSSLSSLTNTNAKVTWWNNLDSSNNAYNIPDVTYQQISVSPTANSYFNSNTYYMPKREF